MILEKFPRCQLLPLDNVLCKDQWLWQSLNGLREMGFEINAKGLQKQVGRDDCVAEMEEDV